MRCNFYVCLCASCANEVNNTYAQPGEMVKPCFHCEDNCFQYDHEPHKKLQNIVECPKYKKTKRQTRIAQGMIKAYDGGKCKNEGI